MKYLSYQERKSIEKMLKEKSKIREIARILNRSHSTISYEIRFNKNQYVKEYKADTAHEKFLKRQNNKGNKSKLKMNPKLKQFVINQMVLEQWSPEQIAGFLKMVDINNFVSHETIYRFIYSDEGMQLRLWLHLRHRKIPKRQFHGTRKNRTTIKFKVPISERSKVANNRKELGHLESDSMIFSKQKNILSVQVERITKKCG